MRFVATTSRLWCNWAIEPCALHNFGSGYGYICGSDRPTVAVRSDATGRVRSPPERRHTLVYKPALG